MDSTVASDQIVAVLYKNINSREHWNLLRDNSSNSLNISHQLFTKASKITDPELIDCVQHCFQRCIFSSEQLVELAIAFIKESHLMASTILTKTFSSFKSSPKKVVGV